MDAYVYNADLLCEDCAREHIVNCKNAGQEDDGDSDSFPQGPYADGGGEADSPQHCGDCGVFLANPLTSEGYREVKERIEQHVHDPSKGNAEVLRAWAEAYEIEWPRAGGYFDRFDVCYAYNAFMTNWHGGQGSIEYAMSGVFSRLKFEPGHGFTQDPWEMPENVRAIYWGLVTGETKLRDRRR